MKRIIKLFIVRNYKLKKLINQILLKSLLQEVRNYCNHDCFKKIRIKQKKINFKFSIFDINFLMKLILGLGNPDAKYSLTRHNFGFRAVDFFAEKNDFPEFRFEKKFRAEISEQKIGNEKVFLVKPQTFMNLSGESARALLDFYKPPLVNFLVIYDDVDLPFGKIRIRESGGSGGHRGVKNLIAHYKQLKLLRCKYRLNWP